MTRDRLVWIFRSVWFLLPLSAGSVLSAALDDSSGGVATAMFVCAWVLWAVVTIGSFVPHPLTLTGVRIIVPLALAVALWALTTDAALSRTVVFVAHSAVALIVAMHQLVGDRFADGASYGDERRMLLRPSVPVAALGVPIAWAVVVAVVPGVVLLASQRWVAGSLLAAVSLVGGPFAARALHQLARRWVVFVPTGMVLHDLAVLTEPVLFRRTAIERLGAAIAGTPARDLTNQAGGLQIECELADPAPLGLVATGRAGAAEMTDVRRFLICPTRPGDLLDEAERRGIATD